MNFDTSETLDALSFDDVAPYIPPDPVDVDEPTIQFIRNNKKSLIERRVARINSMYTELIQFWPEGSPLQFYFALEMCNDVEVDLLENLQDPKFIQRVIDHFETLSKGKGDTEQSEEKDHINDGLKDEFEFIEFSESDFDDESFSIPGFTHQKPHQFTPLELRKFQNLISSLTKPTSWKEISKTMHGRTQKECKLMYKKLYEEGVLDSPFVKNSFIKTDKSKSENLSQFKPFTHIKSLVFLCGDQRSVVGPQSMKYKEYAMTNPLFQYMDIITQEPMLVPALSPDGYVFDYSTWTQILKGGKGINPFTQNVVYRRQLVILTDENINEYRGKIMNLEKIIPNDEK